MTWADRPANWGKPGHRNRSEEFETVLDRIEFLNSRPMFHAVQTVAQTIGNGAFTALTFTTEVVDNYGGHSTSTNNDRYTIQVDGWYQLTGGTGWVASASTTTQRGSSWYKNGNQLDGSQVLFTAGANTTLQQVARTMFVSCVAGDYIELRAYQNTGGNLNTDVAFNGVYSSMSILWVAEAA